MTTQTTVQCIPVDHSDQLHPSSQTSQLKAQEMMSSHTLKPANHKLKRLSHLTLSHQPNASSRDDAIPCYETS